jgi:hypothetical protein
MCVCVSCGTYTVHCSHYSHCCTGLALRAALNLAHLPFFQISHFSFSLFVTTWNYLIYLCRDKEETIKVLSDFALGKGGHYGSE